MCVCSYSSRFPIRSFFKLYIVSPKRSEVISFIANCAKSHFGDDVLNADELEAILQQGNIYDDSVMYKVPDRLRLPLIFYYTHTATVFVNKLILAGLMKDRVNFEFETMFETGVDEMSWDDTENYRMGGSYKWPSVDACVDYRRQVRNIILNIIEHVPLKLPVTIDDQLWALFMGMEHERIHLETSSVLIRQLPVDMVTRPSGWVYGPNKHKQGAGENQLFKTAPQEICLGEPRNFPSFGWDNEYGQVNIVVPEFEASQYLITNQDFLEFVKAGGYCDDTLWTEEGLAWRQYRQARHPVFWTCDQGCKSGCGGDLGKYSHCQPLDNADKIDNGQEITETDPNLYRYRLMFDEIEMPMDWPVTVNYHEARAYCKWRGPEFRLPTEAEHHVIRGDQPPVEKGSSSDIIYQSTIHANVNLQYGSSTPVNLYKPSSTGFYDAFGNVWEWTEDHFNGLPGYQSHWLYDDFSSPCFDGRHNVILGGSWISTGDESSRFARYSFRRHFFQHCGFRIARSLPQNGNNVNVPARVIQPKVFILDVGHTKTDIFVKAQGEPQLVQTTNRQLNCDDHPALYGIIELEFGFRDNYAKIVADIALSYIEMFKCAKSSALHVGSGLGKTSFILSNHFHKVLGVDFSGLFVNKAMSLQKAHQFSYQDVNGMECVVKLDDNHQTDNVVFKQLTWLPNEVGCHNLVLVTFLERTLHPKAWLVRLWEIVREPGIVVVISTDWDQIQLEEVFNDRLDCVASNTIEYEVSGGRLQSHVTVWRKE